MSSFIIETPLRIAVSIGDSAGGANGQIAASADAPGLERATPKDLATCEGYDPNFLGVPVPLPVLSDEQRRNAAKNSMARPGEDNTVLPYHHFSIVMNRRRQLAYYTVVNIDGAQSHRPPRGRDRWSFDPRIAESEQIGGELYDRNKLDKGHLVRRLDPAWGSEREALEASLSTFFYTNCSPQHAGFNQSNETWQGIENYLLDHATSAGLKLTVFTGPIATEEDPIYRGVRLPLAFWKIAVQRGAGDTLAVSAYLLDQKDLIEAGLERFDAKIFQVTVEEISDRTGLDFSYLAAAQVNLASAPEGLERTQEYVRKPIGHLRDIVLEKEPAQ